MTDARHAPRGPELSRHNPVRTVDPWRDLRYERDDGNPPSGRHPPLTAGGLPQSRPPGQPGGLTLPGLRPRQPGAPPRPARAAPPKTRAACSCPANRDH